MLAIVCRHFAFDPFVFSFGTWYQESGLINIRELGSFHKGTGKSTTVKSLKADVSSFHSSLERSDEGLTLDTSAFKLLTVVDLRFQLSC